MTNLKQRTTLTKSADAALLDLERRAAVTILEKVAKEFALQLSLNPYQAGGIEDAKKALKGLQTVIDYIKYKKGLI